MDTAATELPYDSIGCIDIYINAKEFKLVHRPSSERIKMKKTFEHVSFGDLFSTAADISEIMKDASVDWQSDQELTDRLQTYINTI